MAVSHVLYTVVWPTRVKGREHVPREGAALIAANHQSVLDIPLIAKAAHHRHVVFVARATLTQSKVLAFVLRKCRAILIDRDKGDRAALRAMVEVLEAGGIIVIFPEGTRTEDGSLGHPKKGALLAARQAKVPIIPCALDGSYKAWPRKRRFPRPGRIQITFGEPVPPNSEALKATWTQIQAILEPAPTDSPSPTEQVATD